MHLRTPFIVAGGATLILGALAGCSTADPAPAPTKTASPSASAAADAFEPPKKTVACKDGVASVKQSNAVITVDGHCAKVIVDANNSSVSVSGDIETLIVSGSLNGVTARTITDVSFPAASSANLVKSQNTPSIDDKGEQNEVNPTEK